MSRSFSEWLKAKWRREPAQDLLNAYLYTFNTLHGQMVLRDWLDEIYCQTCPVNDPLALAEHNGQRKFIQRIMEALDQAQAPSKYSYNEENTHAT